MTSEWIWPLPPMSRPAGAAHDLWPAAHWSCRRAGWLRRYVSAARRHSAQAAGYYTTLGWRRIPAAERDEDTRNEEKKREREIRDLSLEKHLILEKRGSMRVKRLVYETISTKETQTLIPVNSDDRGHCWGMYNTESGSRAGEEKATAFDVLLISVKQHVCRECPWPLLRCFSRLAYWNDLWDALMSTVIGTLSRGNAWWDALMPGLISPSSRHT